MTMSRAREDFHMTGSTVAGKKTHVECALGGTEFVLIRSSGWSLDCGGLCLINAFGLAQYVWVDGVQ